MSVLPERLAELLAAQHGAVARSQAIQAGLSPSAVRTELRNGRWEQAAPRVYTLRGLGDSWYRQLWVAYLHLGPDACVTHESAGRLHGFDEVPSGLVVLTLPHGRRISSSTARLHRADDLIREHVTLLDGLPVTTPARTVVDLAAVLRPARLRSLIESCVVERRLGLAQIGAALAQVRRRGKPGVTRLSRVLDELGPGDGIPNGELERLFATVVDLAGLPRPVHEHPLPGVGARSGFVDRCWPEAKMIVEIDGRKWHSRRQQVVADHDRALQAQTAGYETSRVLWEHVVHDAAGTAAALRAIYDRRATLLSR